MKNISTSNTSRSMADQASRHLARLPIAVALMACLFLAGSCSSAPDSGGNAATYAIGLVLPSEQATSEPVLRGLDVFLDRYRATLSRELSKEFGIAAPNIVFHHIAADAPEASSQESYPKAATAMAQALMRHRHAIALIGNPTADDEYVDHTFYNDNKIPFMALASSQTQVTHESSWVFSMIYNDEWQGALISEYAKEILQAEHVLVVRGDDMLGLGDSFARYSEKIGLGITGTIAFSSAKNPAEGDFVKQIREAQGKYDAVIVLAHADQALAIVRLLADAKVAVPVLGPDDLSGQSFVNGVNATPDDKLPKQIVVANPFFFELAPIKASMFVQDYQHRYRGQEPSQSAAYAYDAAYLIVRGLMNGLKQGKTETSDLRESIKDYLLSVHSMGKAIDGVSGRLYFDEYGAMRRPVLFSRLEKGKFLPEFTQLLPVRHIRGDQPEKEEAAGKNEQRSGPIFVNGVRMKKVAVVYAGIDVEQIRDINLEAQQFEMQGYLWLKWQDSIPWNEKHKFFWNQILSGEEGVVSLGKHLKTPTKYASFELRSLFKADYDLRQFPFDTQTLTLDLSAAKLGVDETLFVVDKTHLRTKEDLIASDKTLPPGYKLLGVDHFSGTKPFASSLGKVSLGHHGPDYSVYRVALTVKRHPSPYFLKVFLPLFIMLGVSLAVFLIPVQKTFSVRMSLASTALLSAVVLHLSRTQTLPNVEYLTRIDYYFVFAYLFMATIIVASIYKEHLYRRDALHAAVAVNRAVGLILLVGAVAVFTLLSIPSLSVIWPALVATATILATLACSSRLAYVHRKARVKETAS
jgi:branched-chain amino acid transport system substrate-binding protein